MPILDAFRKFLSAFAKYWQRMDSPRTSSPSAPASSFLDEVFAYFPFTKEAQSWLRSSIRVELVDPGRLSGGGGWLPDQKLVRLNTAQYEAAIHELAHAVWHEKRQDRAVRDALVAAVQRLAEDDDPRWKKVHTLAGHYVHGIPTQPGFEQGMLLPRAEWGKGGGAQGEWNDWEMFAGLASGCMADIRLLPPYLCPFYAHLFDKLPPDAPTPASRAPHR